MLLILALIVLAALVAPALSRGREHSIGPVFHLGFGCSPDRTERASIASRGGTRRAHAEVMEVPLYTGRGLQHGRLTAALPHTRLFETKPPRGGERYPPLGTWT